MKPCGHCAVALDVPGTTREFVMAGGRYCERCRQPLCDTCGDKDYHKVNADCVNAGVRKRR